MTGCLAGLLNPDATIYEAQDELPVNHNAVLRFRNDSVSQVTGIPFKKVTVHKGIYHNYEFVQPNISLANLYSYKVLGHFTDRSIWNLDTVHRYVGPPDFQLQLAEKVRPQIHLGMPIEYIPDDTIISTIPLNAILDFAGINSDIDFSFQRIYTKRFTVAKADIYQTIYYPGKETNVYRATMTGSELIIESITNIFKSDVSYVLRSFGIQTSIDEHEEKEQRYGKIKNIDDVERKKLLYKLTSEYNVYSAGRFAIWKNVLMDDVLHDLYQIRLMIDTDPYNRNLPR